MARYEDYIKKSDEIVDKDIDEATKQQEVRKTTTPATDWEKRYKDLEVAYSRQGQQVGDYRKLVDDYLSTPDASLKVEDESVPITADDIFDNPDEAVRKAVDSHPAIRKAKADAETAEVSKKEAMMAKFRTDHPDFDMTVTDEEFANWVKSNPTRFELAIRANDYDMASADALFTIWEAEQTAKKITDKKKSLDSVAAVSLETSTGTEPPAPVRYSRSDMLAKKIRAKQGDPEAGRYVKAHAKAYREALGQGNVRD